MSRRRVRAAWLFLAPALTVLAVFVLYPIGVALADSFTNATPFGGRSWIGLDNYTRLVADQRFTNALSNTALYALVTVPLSVVGALGLAVLLNRRIPARGLFRAVMFFPYVVSLGIVSIGWAFMLDPNIGVVAAWLNDFGWSLGQGVRDPRFAMPAVMMVGVWRNVGFFMVMYLAGIQSIPREVNEAARLDGARGWKTFRHITLPLLSNTSMFVCVIAGIFAFQAFDQMYTMTNGGPFFRTETLVMLIFNTGIKDYQVGYASAMSWALVLIVLALSLAQTVFFNRREVRY
ncbi:MAG: sugar ABC transporter permease [Propionibacteriaceae bacterium]|jgi:ABC-type sugar transport system permease subunit|nr:sugar ABC transporter permease [Propionibacteriaceae bacterium]